MLQKIRVYHGVIGHSYLVDIDGTWFEMDGNPLPNGVNMCIEPPVDMTNPNVHTPMQIPTHLWPKGLVSNINRRIYDLEFDRLAAALHRFACWNDSNGDYDDCSVEELATIVNDMVWAD